MLCAIMPCRLALLPCGIRAELVFSLLLLVQRMCVAGLLQLVKLVAFLATLHWPVAGTDFGVGGLLCRVPHLI